MTLEWQQLGNLCNKCSKQTINWNSSSSDYFYVTSGFTSNTRAPRGPVTLAFLFLLSTTFLNILLNLGGIWRLQGSGLGFSSKSKSIERSINSSLWLTGLRGPSSSWSITMMASSCDDPGLPAWMSNWRGVYSAVLKESIDELGSQALPQGNHYYSQRSH